MVRRLVFRSFLTASLGAVHLAIATAAHAEPPSASPALHHAPVSVAKHGEPIAIAATIDHPELVKSAFVVYRTADTGLRQVPFLRAASGPYVALIPPDDVRTPWVGYTVELEPTYGERRPVFASRSQMHEVQVPEDREDARERALFARLSGRRSVLASSAEYVVFGERSAFGQPVVADRYWRTEASYTYRPLRTIAEFGIRAGVVRGPDTATSDLGLNYAAPRVRVRLGDIWHVEGEFLSSVTEVGFSVGTGAALLIGDPYGSRLALGFESIQVFGTRAYTQMDIAALRDLVVSPVVEVTNMPHADRFGVRLLTRARFDAGKGFSLGVLGGYQARLAASGGPAFGLDASYAF